jgi:hypothetical protein
MENFEISKIHFRAFPMTLKYKLCIIVSAMFEDDSGKTSNMSDASIGRDTPT